MGYARGGASDCRLNGSVAHDGVHLEGPIAVGSFDATFNNAVFEPLPVIENMSVGAPIPPDTSASIGPLIITRLVTRL